MSLFARNKILQKQLGEMIEAIGIGIKQLKNF